MICLKQGYSLNLESLTANSALSKENYVTDLLADRARNIKVCMYICATVFQATIFRNFFIYIACHVCACVCLRINEAICQPYIHL